MRCGQSERRSPLCVRGAAAGEWTTNRFRLQSHAVDTTSPGAVSSSRRTRRRILILFLFLFLFLIFRCGQLTLGGGFGVPSKGLQIRCIEHGRCGTVASYNVLKTQRFLRSLEERHHPAVSVILRHKAFIEPRALHIGRGNGLRSLITTRLTPFEGVRESLRSPFQAPSVPRPPGNDQCGTDAVRQMSCHAGTPRAETGEIRHEIRACLTASSAVRAGAWRGTDRFQTSDALDHAVWDAFIIRLTTGPGKA